MQNLERREERQIRQNEAIRDLIQGRNNASGTVTLATGAATTVVTNTAISKGAKPLLFPATANAAAEVASVYISAVVNGSFTITHPNNATADRTWHYFFNGG